MSAYPVIAFDLDGTLLRDTTVSLLLAESLGRAEEIAELERAFRAHEISNSVIADGSASWLAGLTPEQACEPLADAPWIGGMSEAFQTLHEAGARLLLGTITWNFAAEFLTRRHPFAAVSGTRMRTIDGVLSGEVERYFDEHDKLRFVAAWATGNGYAMRDVAAVGDSRSDVPLFEHAGLSIALNATPEARAVATHALDTEDLRDVLPLLLS